MAEKGRTDCSLVLLNSLEFCGRGIASGDTSGVGGLVCLEPGAGIRGRIFGEDGASGRIIEPDAILHFAVGLTDIRRDGCSLMSADLGMAFDRSA